VKMNPLRLIALKVRDILGLPSIQQVLPIKIFAGDFGDARNLTALKKFGIKYVLNIAAEIDDPDFTSEGITQAKYGLVDEDDNGNEAKVLCAMACLDRWDRTRPFLAPILVHCEGGRNRTLYVLARWYGRRMGIDWRDAALLIQVNRPEMELHAWMIKQGPK